MGSSDELRAEIHIAASPARVWSVVTDTKALAEASPELLAMTPLRRGGFRVGQQYVGWNRRKAVVWTTRNVVRECVPERRLVWDTTTSGARWIYELSPEGDGTRLVQRRPVAKQASRFVRLFGEVLLGGFEEHADELESGMLSSLTRLKAIAER
ncbi:MAG: SRPBCC domain-containing protein, partial [Nocardioidaceae bacterium]|nr:SRPBCC domain-containing protein [Nocardioidaceae bacterium]MCL2613414.1 SRPBCC domain-containing protein [Nocardioidaceae bacterium]